MNVLMFMKKRAEEKQAYIIYKWRAGTMPSAFYMPYLIELPNTWEVGLITFFKFVLFHDAENQTQGLYHTAADLQPTFLIIIKIPLHREVNVKLITKISVF